MSTGKRPPRKTVAPAALPVPRLRTIRGDDAVPEPSALGERVRTHARRARKPRFVF